MDSQPLRQMNYLITGAARGIGRALSRSLVSKGHRVFLLDADATELQHTSRLLRATNSSQASFTTAVADLASLPAIKQAVADADTFFDGKVDVLINNAMAMPHIFPVEVPDGEAAIGLSDEASQAAVEAHWERQIAVGLSAPFHLSRLCVPMLRKSGGKGCIINVSSTRAVQSEVDHEGYSAAKAGLSGLGQSMSQSLGLRYGIRVNSLVLGWVNVEHERREGDEKGAKWEEGLSEEDQRWHAAGRVGQAEDVLRAVEYLVGAEFVTGTETVIDGGVGRRMVYPE